MGTGYVSHRTEVVAEAIVNGVGKHSIGEVT